MKNFLKGNSWQDWVTSGVNLVFAPSLVPMILANQPPPLLSTIPTALGIWALSVTFWTLGLRLGPAALVLAASMWTILAVQGILH